MNRFTRALPVALALAAALGLSGVRASAAAPAQPAALDSAGTLPFLDEVQIGPPRCPTCPWLICPNEPIPVTLRGTLPNSCYQVIGVELLPSLIVGPMPEPPRVRLVLSYACGGGCLEILSHFEREVFLPGLPGRQYQLPVIVDLVSACDTANVLTHAEELFAFPLAPACPTPPPVFPCLLTDWDHSGHTHPCDATVGPEVTGTVSMTVGSSVALAGLQGVLRLYPPGLRITRLEAVGPAAGMHLAWQPTADGASFVMFAEQGAPIPARDSTATTPPPPVLSVTAGLAPGLTPAPVTYLMADQVLGADSLGGAVPECPVMDLERFAARAAVFCLERGCDVTADGIVDVRDIVRMVHCVMGTEVACPDSAFLDCDTNGSVNIDDVLCCARVILRGGAPSDSGPVRQEPAVAVRLEDPSWSASGFTLPVTLTGAPRVGAARLVLAFPTDRYDVAAVEVEPGAPWLVLHEMVDGKLVVGLIGIASPEVARSAATEELHLSLAFSLRGGQPAGGQLQLTGGEFSGPDGVRLATTPPLGMVELPDPGRVSLSSAWPNPFSSETRFAVNLDRRAQVEVSVHDLSGRRVASVFSGRLEAGPHSFAWSGIGANGTPVADGIYFVHARVDRVGLARKVIFLRSR